MTRIHLVKGREKSLQRKHPWIFDGAVKEKNAAIPAGETVVVCDHNDNPLAIGAWSPASQLRIRVWSFDPSETIDREFFRRRIAQAVKMRENLGLLDPDGGCRLIYSESDLLPGIIVDRYGEFAVLQLLSAGAEFSAISSPKPFWNCHLSRGSLSVQTPRYGRKRLLRCVPVIWQGKLCRKRSLSGKTVWILR